MDAPIVELEAQDGVAWLRLNRPEALNALDLPHTRELNDRLEELAAAEDVRVVVLTGAGEKAFVAGADIKYMQGLATELALPADDVEEVLSGERYRDRIEGSTAQAVSIGANAVPAFLLDRRLLVLGAQPEELFEQAFERLQEPA